VIGNRSDGGVPFNGNIDETGVWSKALSSTEVSNLYNSGNADTFTGGAQNNIGTGLAFSDTNSIGTGVTDAQIASTLTSVVSGSETSNVLIKTINAGGSLSTVGTFTNSGTD